MSKGIRDDLIAEIHAFMQEFGMPSSVFGARAMNDRSFVQRLGEPNKIVTSVTIDHVRQYMADYRSKYGARNDARRR